MTTLTNPYWEVVQTFPEDHLGFGRSKRVFTPDSYPFIGRMMKAQPDPLMMLKESLSVLEKMLDTPGEHTEGPTEDDMKMTRSNLVNQFAWAIPSDDAIHWLAKQLKGRPVVELGAGNGYWAHLLEQVGIEVTAYDRALAWRGDENHWIRSDTKVWHPVRRGTQAMVRNHQDKVLMLCWPPYNNRFAVETLRYYQGDTLVYVGEHEGGCCADDEFFAALEQDWIETACYDEMIQWSGIHDYMWVYRRNVHMISEEP
jgi:hypothetical protein